MSDTPTPDDARYGPERRRDMQDMYALHDQMAKTAAELGKLATDAGAKLSRFDEISLGISQQIRAVRADVANLHFTLNRYVDIETARSTTANLIKRRRIITLVMLVVLLLTVQIGDIHNEQCGPGHRAEAIVEGLVKGRVQTSQDLKDIVDDSTPAIWCDVLYPTHSHRFENEFPTTRNWAGFGMYAALLAAALFYVRRRPNVEKEMPHTGAGPLEALHRRIDDDNAAAATVAAEDKAEPDGPAVKEEPMEDHP